MMQLKPHKNVLRITAAAAAAAVFAAGFSGSAAAKPNPERQKSETVYAVLSNDGAYTGATVVNCFYTDGEIVDYGEYASVENLSGPDAPVIDGDKITWPAGLGGKDGFYYQGETQKALPVSFEIAYSLNGRTARPEEITGRTGELKIDITMRNNTGTGETDELTGREIMTPFAVQISFSLDGAMYTVRDIPETASVVKAGSGYTVAYSAFPLPESTFSLMLFGTNMALEPISIVAIPKALPGLDTFGDYIDIDALTSGADDMLAGAEDMKSGANELLNGLKEMKNAAKQTQSGLKSLASGASSLENGADALYTNIKALETSADSFYAGMSAFASSFASFDTGMGTLEANAAATAKTISDLSALAAGVDGGMGQMCAGLEGLAASNKTLAENAAALAASDPAAAPLAAGLNAQQDAIMNMTSSAGSLKSSSAQLGAGLVQFSAGFTGDFAAGVSQLRAASASLYASCLQLLDGAYGIKSACGKLRGAAGTLSGGADDVAEGASEAAAQAPQLIEALDRLIDGMWRLKDGISDLDEDGLRPLKDDFDGMQAYLNALSEKAESYRSFMDGRNNASVQFILKTKGF